MLKIRWNVLVSGIVLSVLTTGAARAAMLASDDFTYADGSSLTANAAWGTHSGTPGDLLVDGGRAIVQHGAPSEDANISFVDVSTGVLTADFDIIVSDDTQISGSDSEYFAHFFTDGSFNFRSRVDIVPASGSGDYTLGISTESSTAQETLSTDFAFGDVVPVQIAFDLDSGIGSLTAGGETIQGTGIALGETLNRFALRQSDSDNNETVSVDNLVIQGVPEPTSFVLAGAIGLVMMTLRRR